MQPVASSRTEKNGFQKKHLNHSIMLLQQSSDKRDAKRKELLKHII